MPQKALPSKAGKGRKFADEDRFQITGVSGRLGAEHTDRTGGGGDCHEKGDYSEEGEAGGDRAVDGGSAEPGKEPPLRVPEMDEFMGKAHLAELCRKLPELGPNLLSLPILRRF